MRISHALGILLSSSFFSYPVVGTPEPGAAAHWGAKIAPVCDDVSATADAGGEDALIFHLTPEQRRFLISSDPDEFASRFASFVAKVKDAFDKEGLVVIRGIFDDDLLDRIDKDAQAVADAPTPNNDFTTLKFGPVFSDTAFREAALSSAVPHFVAKVLLELRKNDPTTLRVLKDAFLVKGDEKKCCGWHVDDAGFWPTSAKSTPGVNAWIAIDDIPSNFGGGLAVSPRSHLAEWRHDAYEAIGSTQIHPEEGLVPGTPSYKRIIGTGFGKTCDMEVHAPELAAMIDGTKKVFNFKRGDVLFHTRWIFHRSMPMTDEGKEYFRKLGKNPVVKRYSIRYEFGSSRLLRGMSGEFAIFNNPQNSGKSLDEVCGSDGPYYPRCWPPVTDDDMRNIDQLVTDKFPLAEAKRKERIDKYRESLAAEE